MFELASLRMDLGAAQFVLVAASAFVVLAIVAFAVVEIVKRFVGLALGQRLVDEKLIKREAIGPLRIRRPLDELCRERAGTWAGS